MKLKGYNPKIATIVGLALILAGVFSWYNQSVDSVRPLTVEEQEILVSVLDRLPSESSRDRVLGEWQRLFASHAGSVYSGFRIGGAWIKMEGGSLSISQSFFEADPVAQEQMLLNWMKTRPSA